MLSITNPALPPTSPLPAPISPQPPGRPRALDETKRREICAMVATGCGLASAARYVGCDVSTIRREARRNRDFGQRLRRAQRDCELAPLAAMRKAAKRYWRAAAWLLERINAERYGKSDPQAIKFEPLKDYTRSLMGIVFSEVKDQRLAYRVHYAFKQVLEHCEREIEAKRSPFPIPRAVTQLNERPGSPYEIFSRPWREAEEQAREALASQQRSAAFAAQRERQNSP